MEEREWKNHTVTQQLLSELKKNIEYIKDDWSNGAYLEKSTEMRALGQIEALREVEFFIENLGKEGV